MVRSSAAGFDRVLRKDATEDYYFTSLEFMRRIKRFVAARSKAALLKDLARVNLLKDPYWLHRVLSLVCGTWLWPFDSTRSEPPPAQHLWLVLQAREQPAR